MDIRGKTALVTGASRGLGAYVSRSLVEHGAHVVGVARTAQGLEEVRREVERIHSRFTPIPFGLSRADRVGELHDQVTNQVGTIDILVNNAGIEQ